MTNPSYAVAKVCSSCTLQTLRCSSPAQQWAQDLAWYQISCPVLPEQENPFTLRLRASSDLKTNKRCLKTENFCVCTCRCFTTRCGCSEGCFGWGVWCFRGLLGSSCTQCFQFVTCCVMLPMGRWSKHGAGWQGGPWAGVLLEQLGWVLLSHLDLQRGKLQHGLRDKKCAGVYNDVFGMGFSVWMWVCFCLGGLWLCGPEGCCRDAAKAFGNACWWEAAQAAVCWESRRVGCSDIMSAWKRSCGHLWMHPWAAAHVPNIHLKAAGMRLVLPWARLWTTTYGF